MESGLEVSSVIRNSIGTINTTSELECTGRDLKDGDQTLNLFIPGQLGWPANG